MSDENNATRWTPSRSSHECEQHPNPSPSMVRKPLIKIAIQPTFARFSRCDHRMAEGPGVLAGVLIRGTVAAQRDSALLTGSKVDPSCANLRALLALPLLRVLDGVDGGDMSAGSVSHLRSGGFTNYSAITRWTNDT